MRYQRLFRTLLALTVAMGLGVIVASAASADSGKIKFRGQANVLGLIPGTTISTFEYKRDGSIKSVGVHTVGETVIAGPLAVECKPATSTACDALNGSLLFDVHISDEVLRNVEVVPNPFAPALFPFLDAISGQLSGELQGSLSVIGGDAALVGGIQMNIHGTATLGCFAPGPVPIATCEATLGVLQPIVFDVDDHGDFDIDAGLVGATPVTGGEGKVRVELAGDVSTFPPTFAGVVVINDATLTTE